MSVRHPLSAAITVMTEIIMIAIRINTITEFRKCVFDQLLIKENENFGATEANEHEREKIQHRIIFIKDGIKI